MTQPSRLTTPTSRSNYYLCQSLLEWMLAPKRGVGMVSILLYLGECLTAAGAPVDLEGCTFEIRAAIDRWCLTLSVPISPVIITSYYPHHAKLQTLFVPTLSCILVEGVCLFSFTEQLKALYCNGKWTFADSTHQRFTRDLIFWSVWLIEQKNTYRCLEITYGYALQLPKVGL